MRAKANTITPRDLNTVAPRILRLVCLRLPRRLGGPPPRLEVARPACEGVIGALLASLAARRAPPPQRDPRDDTPRNRPSQAWATAQSAGGRAHGRTPWGGCCLRLSTSRGVLMYAL